MAPKWGSVIGTMLFQVYFNFDNLNEIRYVPVK